MINDIIQQGSIRVTERGTEAGVSTYTSLKLGFPRKIHYKQMKVNRPFIFEIVEKHSGLRLFAGVVNKV
jgi:serine protease inhibitor